MNNSYVYHKSLIHHIWHWNWLENSYPAMKDRRCSQVVPHWQNPQPTYQNVTPWGGELWLHSLKLNTHALRKIRIIEGNEKCRRLKKLTCKGNLRQVFICLRPRTPYPLPLHTVHVQFVHTVRVYSTVYLFTKGRGGEGGEMNEIEG
jgi:hypothetical protein